MNRASAAKLIDCLTFSKSENAVDGLATIPQKHWMHLLAWLDDSGLSLYFLRALQTAGATKVLPAHILDALECRLCANQRRTAAMLECFDRINGEFEKAGMRYAVVKGISLMPEFCPDLALRHQGDFDYLVEEEALRRSDEILVRLGYRAKASRSKEEFIYVTDGRPTRGAGQYSPDAPHAVELHLDIWDSELHRFSDVPAVFSAERTVERAIDGHRFHALDDEDAFLLQVVHACHHIFTHWIRMSCLYEIGYFLDSHADHSEFWDRIGQRVGDESVLREFMVVVAQLAAQLFRAPLPALVSSWRAETRPPIRVWMDRYARKWAFSEVPVYQFDPLPTSKLAVLLQRQYRSLESAAANQESRVASSRMRGMFTSVKREPGLLLQPQWWKRQMLLQRTAFHALAGLRLLLEMPRWLWLNRASASYPHVGERQRNLNLAHNLPGNRQRSL